MNSRSIFFQAFFQGFTGAGLFGRLRRPGAPTEFVDSRSVEEFLASTDFDLEVAKARALKRTSQANEAAATIKPNTPFVPRHN